LKCCEDGVTVLRRDARSAIDDADFHGVAVCAGGDAHRLISGAVAHGVVYEVGDDAFEQARVGEDFGQRGGHIDVDVAAGGGVVEGAADDVLDADGVDDHG
jgi:hypothetical protein